MTRNRLIAAIAALLCSGGVALAGTGTVTVLDSTGATKTYALVTNGAAQFIAEGVVCDGTAAAQCAAVKAASTAAVATDPALVVSVSPNNPVAVTQSGSWTINGISGALSLPTGAATAALQPSNVTPGSTSAGTTGNIQLGFVTTAAPTYTTGQVNALSLTPAGEVRVNISSGGAAGGTSSSFGAAFPAIGTALGLTNGTNMVPWSATSNYGTAPSTIAVPAVNANVTNTNPNGPATMANSSPVTIASNQTPLPVQQASQYPTNATPLTASATGTTATTTATLAGSAGVTTFVCGFSIRANATAALTSNATVTGAITGTLNYTQWIAPAASGLGVVEEIFVPCIPASAANTGIAVSSAAAGTGGVVSVAAWGYRL